MRRSYFRLGLCFEITWHFAAIVVMPGCSKVFGRFPDVEVTAKGSAKFVAACSDTANVRLVPGVDFKRKEKQETPNKVFFGGNGGNAAAGIVFAAPPSALVSASGNVAHAHQVGGRCGAQCKANDGLFQSMDFGQKGWECGRAIH
jgi:hypothetical protein